jgi:hypothetical protein
VRLERFLTEVLHGPSNRRGHGTHRGVVVLDPAVAEMDMGKPPFKASDGGLIDRLRELEEITQSEFQQGSGT